MPKNTATVKQITVPASGLALDAITAYAATHDLPLGRAVIALIEAQPSAAPQEPAPVAPLDLDALSIEDLLAAVGRRFAAAARDDDAVAALTARAEAAEGRWASLRDSLRGLVA